MTEQRLKEIELLFKYGVPSYAETAALLIPATAELIAEVRRLREVLNDHGGKRL